MKQISCLSLALAFAFALALLPGCEPVNSFSGTWLVHLTEIDRAYWTASKGDSDRTLVMEESEGTVSGRFDDMPDHWFSGSVEAGLATLESRVGDVVMTLQLTVAGSVLSGELTHSVREDYGGWWKWRLEGRRR